MGITETLIIVKILSLISSPAKVILGSCGWYLHLNCNFFPGKQRKRNEIRSIIVWTWESWA